MVDPGLMQSSHNGHNETNRILCGGCCGISLLKRLSWRKVTACCLLSSCHTETTEFAYKRSIELSYRVYLYVYSYAWCDDEIHFFSSFIHVEWSYHQTDQTRDGENIVKKGKEEKKA